MPIIGIISVPQKRQSLVGKMFNKIKIKEKFGDSPEYIVAETAACMADLALMSAAKAKRLMEKAERILTRSGAEVVLLSKSCKTVEFCNGYMHKDKSYRIPYTKIFDCFWFCCDKVGADYNKSLHLFDRRLAAVNYECLSRLCMSVRNLTLYTDDAGEAEALAERLFAEYGICIKVAACRDTETKSTAHMLLDADKGVVRIGDFRVDGAEFFSKSGEYGLDAAEEIAFLGDNADFEVRAWRAGKNVIKIS